MENRALHREVYCEMRGMGNPARPARRVPYLAARLSMAAWLGSMRDVKKGEIT